MICSFIRKCKCTLLYLWKTVWGRIHSNSLAHLPLSLSVCCVLSSPSLSPNHIIPPLVYKLYGHNGFVCFFLHWWYLQNVATCSVAFWFICHLGGDCDINGECLCTMVKSKGYLSYFLQVFFIISQTFYTLVDSRWLLFWLTLSQALKCILEQYKIIIKIIFIINAREQWLSSYPARFIALGLMSQCVSTWLRCCSLLKS